MASFILWGEKKGGLVLKQKACFKVKKSSQVKI